LEIELHKPGTQIDYFGYRAHHWEKSNWQSELITEGKNVFTPMTKARKISRTQIYNRVIFDEIY